MTITDKLFGLGRLILNTNNDSEDQEQINELITRLYAEPIPEIASCSHRWMGHRCGLCEPGFHIVCEECGEELCAGLTDSQGQSQRAVEEISSRIESVLYDAFMSPRQRRRYDA